MTPKPVFCLLHLLHAAITAGVCISAWIMGTFVLVSPLFASHVAQTQPSPGAQKHPQLPPTEPEDLLPRDRSIDIWHFSTFTVFPPV